MRRFFGFVLLLIAVFALGSALVQMGLIRNASFVTIAAWVMVAGIAVHLLNSAPAPAAPAAGAAATAGETSRWASYLTGNHLIVSVAVVLGLGVIFGIWTHLKEQAPFTSLALETQAVNSDLKTAAAIEPMETHGRKIIHEATHASQQMADRTLRATTESLKIQLEKGTITQEQYHIKVQEAVDQHTKAVKLNEATRERVNPPTKKSEVAEPKSATPVYRSWWDSFLELMKTQPDPIPAITLFGGVAALVWLLVSITDSKQFKPALGLIGFLVALNLVGWFYNQRDNSTVYAHSASRPVVVSSTGVGRGSVPVKIVNVDASRLRWDGNNPELMWHHTDITLDTGETLEFIVTDYDIHRDGQGPCGSVNGCGFSPQFAGPLFSPKHSHLAIMVQVGDNHPVSLAQGAIRGVLDSRDVGTGPVKFSYNGTTIPEHWKEIQGGYKVTFIARP